MGTAATSWETKTNSPERVAVALGQAMAQVRNPAGALVFTSGALAGDLPAVGRAIVAHGNKVPVTVVAGGGVLTERGEIEDQSAAAGVVWTGGRSEIVEIVPGDDDDVGESLARVLGDRTGKTSPTVLLFLQPDGFGPSTLEPLRDLRGTRNVFGAGTVGGTGAVGIDPRGRGLLVALEGVARGSPAPRGIHDYAC